MKTGAGLPAKIISYFLAFLLTLSILLTVCTSLVTALTCTDGLWREMLAGDTAVESAWTQIQTRLGELAQRYQFDVSLLDTVVTKDVVRQQGSDSAAWVTALFTANRRNAAPGIDASQVYDLLMADTAFRELYGNKAASTARQIMSSVKNTVDQAVLPVRTSVITVGLNQVDKKVDINRLTALLPWVPSILTAFCALLAAAIAFIIAREPGGGCLFNGSAMLLSGLLLCGLAIASGVGLPGLFSRYSAAAGSLIGRLNPIIAGVLGGFALILLVAGFVLLRLSRRAVRRQA